MLAEVFIALRDDAQTSIVERLQWDEETQGEYTGPVGDREYKIFRYMQNRVERQKLFKTPDIGGNVWHLWAIVFESNLPAVQVELDYLAATYPNRIIIAGAFIWNWGDMACRQAGTQLVIDTRTVTKTWSVLNPDYQPDPAEPNFDDRYVLRITGDVEEEYVSGHTGTPTYPIHPNTIDFMPDVGEPPVPATELVDVNLLMGQPPRNYL